MLGSTSEGCGGEVRVARSVARGEVMTDAQEESRSDIELLAKLIKERNANEVAITNIIKRPAQLGHLGEYIASKIFSIELEESAVHVGSDGVFTKDPLVGKSVNIKMYGKREGILDIGEEYVPDYYLVLAGPKATQSTSKGATRPWVIKEVFLFDGPALVGRLRKRGVKIGIAISVVLAEWESARIYPSSEDSPLKIDENQERLLMLYGQDR